MDYDVLNSAVADIVWIVNQYNKTREYSVSLCEELVLTLFGYYITFGPEIFKKIDTVLSALEINQCNTPEALIKLKQQLCPYDIEQDANPGLLWKRHYNGADNRFIGAIPQILFYSNNQITDVFSLSHELSHALEGTSAEIIEETPEKLTIKQGMGKYTVNKKTNGHIAEGQGMTELITVTIENKILREYLNLNPEQITNPLVKDFITQIKAYQGQNPMLNSYGIMSGLFKDLIDNEIFFDMIKTNYYDNHQETLAEEFDSLDERLSFKRLTLYADKVASGNFSEAMYYALPIQKQLDILNEKTGVTPDKGIILVI